MGGLQRYGYVKPSHLPISLMIKKQEAKRWTIGKGICQDWILSPYLFNLCLDYSKRNGGLEQKLELKLQGELSLTLDMLMKARKTRNLLKI